MRYILTLLILTLLSCSPNKNNSDKDHLSSEEIAQMKIFVDSLNEAIQSYNYDFVKKSWDHELFRSRVEGLSYTERGVFEHIYDTQIANTVENANVEVINQIRHSNGHLTHVKTNIADGNFAETTYLMELDKIFYFLKYRIEMLDKQPKLSDLYFFNEEKWLSDIAEEVARLSTKYPAMSTDRYETNISYNNFSAALSRGDTLQALIELNSIPKSHQISTQLRIARIKLAAQLNDSIFLDVIEKEEELDNSLYIDYLIGIYLGDTILNSQNTRRISSEIGVSRSLLDSLHGKGLYWN